MATRFRSRYIAHPGMNRGGLASGYGTTVVDTSSVSPLSAPIDWPNPQHYTPVGTGYSSSNFIQDVDPKATTPYSREEVHPMTHYKIEPAVVRGDGHLYYSPPVPVCHCSGSFPCWYDPGFPNPTYQWTPVYDSLASQLAGRNRDSSLILVSIKELRETIGMIRNPFGVLRAPRLKPRQKSRISLLKGLSSGLLEYTFGWKSLYSDVTSIAKTCAQIYAPGGLLGNLEELSQRYSASNKQSLGSFQVVSGGYTPAQYESQNPLSIGSATTMIMVEGSGQFENRAGGYLIQNSLDRFKRSQGIWKLATGLGLSGWRSYRDFLWEIVPYSFVIDWFVDSRGIWAPIAKHEVLQADLQRTCYSTLKTWHFSVRAKVNIWTWARNAAGTPWYNQVPVSSQLHEWRGAGRGEYYKRYSGLPDYSEASIRFNTEGLSFMQYALSGALITQRLRF